MVNEVMKKIFSIALMALTVIGMTSCIRMMNGVITCSETLNHEYKDSEEFGKVIEKVIDAKDFTEVEVHGAIQVMLDQSSDSASFTVVARGNEKNLDKYEVYVENGKLVAQLKNHSSSVNDDTPRITVKLHVPSVAKIDLSGACILRQEQAFHQRQTLYVEASGATHVMMNGFETDVLKMNLSGASDVDLTAVKCLGILELEADGASDFRGDITSQCLTATVSGAGDIDLDIDCSSDVTIHASGAADIDLKGKCKNLNVDANKYSCDVDVDDLEVSGTKQIDD